MTPSQGTVKAISKRKKKRCWGGSYAAARPRPVGALVDSAIKVHRRSGIWLAVAAAVLAAVRLNQQRQCLPAGDIVPAAQ